MSVQPAPHGDAFAEIAFREHPGSRDGMSELPPPAYDKSFFYPSAEAAPHGGQPPYEARLHAFRDELKRLREAYRPFMRNLIPPPRLHRSRQSCRQFEFRYQTAEDADFNRVLEGAGDWESITVPDFRGPTGAKGRWTGFYRTEFNHAPVPAGKRVYLVFKGVDYKTVVYLNRKCIGSHEGFFAPFEFDVTDYLQTSNTLVVEVHNDYPMMGVGGSKLDGDKMYAATGPGWDDPYSGWNHCPPGAGIYNQVYLEKRPALFVQDVFVRPDIDGGFVEVWIDVFQTENGLKEDFGLQLQIMPKNFEGAVLGPMTFPVAYAGPGLNYYRYKVDFPSFNLWRPEAPYLYTARVELMEDGSPRDSFDRTFGMRKFHMDESGPVKGTLYLNNRPVILRGANEMGHLQQCVMTGDYEQLIDDILIAKLANLNFYRITQRPVQEEIYDHFDMLGMMHQCDLPTFGFIRRSQFVEGVRQAAEMERLIRSHPSSVMVSLINEPSRTEKRRKGHRHLHRSELEAFFVASRQAIYVENPDRVVKNADGDYNPPTREGLPDFHCYNMWYTNNGISVGKMYKGYLPAIRDGWKAGCGEYGTEGLDRLELMQAKYPAEWLPASEKERWFPNRIHGAQSYSLHGDWYPEQETVGEWIEASQKHQALAARLMTDAWRRRADRVVSTAIHLLIDAWPSGWMKALVGVDRVPKPAFFTYKDSLEPSRVSLRCDRWKAYEGETLEIEAWLLNDAPEELEGCRILATLRDDDGDYAHYETKAGVQAAAAGYAGTIRVTVPQTEDRREMYVDACLLNAQGRRLALERFTFEAFARSSAAIPKPAKVIAADSGARMLCTLLDLPAEPPAGAELPDGPLLVTSHEAYTENRTGILNKVMAGGTAVLVLSGGADKSEWDLGNSSVRAVKLREVYTLACSPAADEEALGWMQADDFAYFYNLTQDRLDGIAGCWLEGEGIEPILWSYRSEGERDGKRRLPVAGVKRLGQGRLYLICMPLAGRAGCNPTLDRLLISLLGRKGECAPCMPSSAGTDES
ncbi:LacZ protein [Paenibacillus mucilaginosus K02]|uniref:LacZ protein n=2 Tax=Paenibacillus mucilaginosus TaxID=61624 RepID=I0BLJ7_9BACL|nr:LacZ protein [Paenibacillus mucilaginosus K02]